jgi:hypothetical protein
METAIISIICIALIVFGGMTMAQGFMTSVDASTNGLQQVGQRDEAILRTEITPVDAVVTPQVDGRDLLEITVKNTGQTKIADFEDWDLIVQYYDGGGTYHVEWLPYSGTAATYEWEVTWIHLNSAPEVVDPGVLNPGESMLITTYLDPAAGAGTTNLAVISTPSGVTASTYFLP